jgi:tRNA A-37 threonylcarbamoyl transferase component Bud32
VISGFPYVSRRQQELLNAWLPGAEVTTNHSWGLVGTTVLELVHDGERYIAKAGDAKDHHLAREIRAHREWLRPWTSTGQAPHLVRADEDAKLLVTRYLAGDLVQGTDCEQLPDTYRQAGELLARFHQQLSAEDDEFGAREKRTALRWLAKPHRIDPDVAARLRGVVEAWPTPPSTVVPTHGDWQPRNWLMHHGTVRIIDFGRADLRPSMTDFARLAARQFRQDTKLESAFLEGYGADPREPAAWQRTMIREAIATAVWAYQVGDERFEHQGHQMIAEALADT